MQYTSHYLELVQQLQCIIFTCQKYYDYSCGPKNSTQFQLLHRVTDDSKYGRNENEFNFFTLKDESFDEYESGIVPRIVKEIMEKKKTTKDLNLYV